MNQLSETIRPLLIEEHRRPSEVRRHVRLLATDLVNDLRSYLSGEGKHLFVFILRGSMLLYCPIAEAFDKASFCFVYRDSLTETTEGHYDSIILVDTIVDTGKTIINAKSMLQTSNLNTDNWVVVVACANKSAQKKLEEEFNQVFCVEYTDDLPVMIDAGAFVANGDATRLSGDSV